MRLVPRRAHLRVWRRRQAGRLLPRKECEQAASTSHPPRAIPLVTTPPPVFGCALAVIKVICKLPRAPHGPGPNYDVYDTTMDIEDLNDKLTSGILEDAWTLPEQKRFAGEEPTSATPECRTAEERFKSFLHDRLRSESDSSPRGLGWKHPAASGTAVLVRSVGAQPTPATSTGS